MAERSYHHGSLRTVLLDAAQDTLREHGVGALSLRDLARQAGVSHGAPRNHFPDRRALLDAVAATGFCRLTAEIRDAVEEGEDAAEALQRATRAFGRFALDEAALLELMFTAKNDGASDDLEQAAQALFVVMHDVVVRAQEVGILPAGDPARLNMLLGATLQGVTTFHASGRVDRALADALVDDTVALFTRPTGA